MHYGLLDPATPDYYNEFTSPNIRFSGCGDQKI
jgi:hypothetical protein